MRLMARASIQGHGDEYRRPAAVLDPARPIAGSTRRLRLTVRPVLKYGLLNSDMAYSCRTKLQSADGSTNGFRKWFNCGRYSTILRSRAPVPLVPGATCSGKLP